MQRTITEARNALEATPGLSDAQRRDAEAEITAATSEAQRVAEAMLAGRVNEVADIRDDALADLCSVRDDFAALAKEADLGRISARDYETRLRRLQADHRRAERHLSTVEDTLTFVTGVEADPFAYSEGLYAKFPLTRPDFSF